MKRHRPILLFVLLFTVLHSYSQEIVLTEVLQANRDKLYRNIIKNSINAKLSFTLSDSTEDKWKDALWSLELINYKSPWVNNRIIEGCKELHKRSADFQRAYLELIYTMYPETFKQEVYAHMLQTDYPKIFALCAVYLLRQNNDSLLLKEVLQKTSEKLKVHTENPILKGLQQQLMYKEKNITGILYQLLEKKYLLGNTLMISFQRSNRDFPGLVMIRNRNGNFVRTGTDTFFHVPQLGRSVSNLPGYLTNGNTPEGVFRMYGYDHSKSSFIGPTTNIQLTMPFETTADFFFKDSNLPVNYWELEKYKNLLPEKFRDYIPLFQSYYAGKAGRTEIIAHGSTVDPEYYKGKSFYPITPTQGCLSTREIWSGETGKLLESDQQKLVEALNKAGGSDGYAIVINIDDKQAPVSIEDILPFLKQAGQY